MNYVLDLIDINDIIVYLSNMSATPSALMPAVLLGNRMLHKL